MAVFLEVFLEYCCEEGKECIVPYHKVLTSKICRNCQLSFLISLIMKNRLDISNFHDKIMLCKLKELVKLNN